MKFCIILTLIVSHMSLGATTSRYKGTSDLYSTSWDSTVADDCYMSVLENKTGYMVLTSDSSIYFAIPRSKIKRYTKGIEQYKKDHFEGVSNPSRHGQMKLGFVKRGKRLVPQKYLVTSEGAQKVCYLQKRT